MTLNLMDRSLYFKGLLILSRIDKYVKSQEKEILRKVGNSLGFNKEFCEATINEVIENKHIKDEPLKFSNQQIANMFLRDAIKLAFCDSNLDEKEYEWIIKCAKINKIPEIRIKEKITSFLDAKDDLMNEQLDVINYDWQSFFLPVVTIRKNEEIKS
jgi:hypothetical protein